MKKLLLGALSLAIPGLFFFGNMAYAPRAEALEPQCPGCPLALTVRGEA
ncbi:hypothetical protein HUA78_34115 [Myxococcus sp. CA033]|nr:hypothetical protein [Myxococcus sp. CA033]NTX39485.1 hypothetical protein [Myxococcus sp. CA033]